MPSAKDIADQYQRLEQHRRNLQRLLQQAVHHGGEVQAPLATQNSLAESRKDIARCKAVLRGWGLDVEDLPDDGAEDTPAVLMPAAAPSSAQATTQGGLRLGPQNTLWRLRGHPDGAPVEIGVNHLIFYSGPREGLDDQALAALALAYRSELLWRYARLRALPAPRALHVTPAAPLDEAEVWPFDALHAAPAEQALDGLRAGLELYGDLLLLGAPGAGKTALLGRLALELAEEGLFRDAQAPLPVLVRLPGREAGQTLAEHIQLGLLAPLRDSSGRETLLPAHRLLAAHVPRLLAEGRLALLWDGLSSLSLADQVQVARELDFLRRVHPALPGQATRHVVACRAADHDRLLEECGGHSPLPLALVRIQSQDQPPAPARPPQASEQGPASKLPDEVRAALAQIGDPAQPLAVRLAAGETLGCLGDPRLLDVRTGDAPVGGYWCPIEPGPFWFGDDDQGKLEQITLPYAYRIARFPVTNAEYRRFIEAGGYKTKSWWGAEGWKWKVQRPETTKPYHWDNPHYNQLTQPVMGVGWYEAVAYCAWLTSQGHTYGWLPQDAVVRLPTWREWQRAARHTDRRRYPWGDAEPDPARANSKETGLQKLAPVGCFPAGQAACGALDLAGNVWEWTATPWQETGKFQPLTDTSSSMGLIFSGGSFLTGNEYLCCGARGRYIPSNWFYYLGFRVVWSPRSLV